MRSKKRSAASESPPSITLLLDENLQGPKIFNPLRAAGLPVTRLEDHFPRGIPDEDLLSGIAGMAGNWFLVTRDERMRYRPGVVLRLNSSNIGILVVTAGKCMDGEQLAALLMRAWSRLPGFLATTQAPFIAAIGADGSIKRLGRR